MKPKNSARGTAKRRAAPLQKLKISRSGEIGDSDAVDLIESIHELKMHCLFPLNPPIPKEQLAIRESHINGDILDAFIGAVLNGDKAFFERCARAVEWMNAGAKTADPNAYRVLSAIETLSILKPDATITSGAIKKEMDRKIDLEIKWRLIKAPPHDGGMAERDIREIVKTLGLGRCPLDPKKINALDASYCRQRFEEHLKTLDSGGNKSTRTPPPKRE